MSQTVSLPTGTIAWASGGHAPKVPADLRVGELLERAAEADVSIVFVQGGKECRIPCRELARRARQRAAALLDRGIGPDSRVGLLEAASRDFVESFFGVLLTGAAVVVLPPPLPFGRTASVAAQLARIVDRAGLAAAIVSPHLAELAAAAGVARVWTASELQAPDPLRIERAAADAPAIIQFTSGSTSSPRGAVLSHGAVLAEVAGICSTSQIDEKDVMCSWLPLYHDMGLIGGVLVPMYARIPLVLMPTEQFLARPLSWLEAISRHRVTLSPAPNFAYALAASRLTREGGRDDLDLSSWRVAYNGGEPIDVRSLDAFLAVAGDIGFRRETMTPCYGLAEATLAVTLPHKDCPPLELVVDPDALANRGCVQLVAPDAPRAKRLVSNGPPMPGTTVAVVTPEGAARGTSVGHILVQGPTLMRGYLNDAVETARMIGGGWVDTGDLGFLHAGELFVTGRAKDVIIARGRNFYPQDIEAVANVAPGIRKGTAVATGSSQVFGEDLLIFAETKLTDPSALREAALAVEASVRAEIGIQAALVVLLPPAGLPKTSSGKIQRRRTLDLYRSGELPILHVRGEFRSAA